MGSESSREISFDVKPRLGCLALRWGTSCQLKSGAANSPFSESHVDGFQTHPTSMQEQQKARDLIVGRNTSLDKQISVKNRRNHTPFFAQYSPTNVEARAITESPG